METRRLSPGICSIFVLYSLQASESRNTAMSVGTDSYLMRDQVHELVASLMPTDRNVNTRWKRRLKRSAEIGALSLVGCVYSVILMWQL
jgi:hypothetical protein